MNQAYYFIISYMAVIIIGFRIVNWLLSGALITILRVKMSRGKKVLVRVRMVTTDRFRMGEIFEGFLIYKDEKKNNRRINFSDRSYIVRSFGVNCVDVDDEKNAVVKPDFSAVTGFDAVRFDNLFTRALMAGHPIDQLVKIILIIVVILALLILANIFLTYKMGSGINVRLDSLVTIAQNATGTV